MRDADVNGVKTCALPMPEVHELLVHDEAVELDDSDVLGDRVEGTPERWVLEEPVAERLEVAGKRLDHGIVWQPLLLALKFLDVAAGRVPFFGQCPDIRVLAVDALLRHEPGEVLERRPADQIDEPGDQGLVRRQAVEHEGKAGLLCVVAAAADMDSVSPSVNHVIPTRTRT